MTPEEAAIRERHVYRTDEIDGRTIHFCKCGKGWPCDTVQTLALLDAARAEVDRLTVLVTSLQTLLRGDGALIRAERARIAAEVRGLRYIDDAVWQECLDAVELAIAKGAEHE